MNESLLTQFFNIGSLFVFPFWFLMAFLPHWRWTKRVIASPLIILGPVLLYALSVLPEVGTVLAPLRSPTLEGVSALLSTPLGTAASWQHFLAFDLFMGRWIYLDSRAKGVSAWLVAPLLYLTLMLGPVGFLSYVLLRAFWLLFRGQGWKEIFFLGKAGRVYGSSTVPLK